MESKKYEYVGVGVERKIDGREVRVYQIRAVKTFVNAATGIKVKRGELGGYITKNALSQNGTCWVDEASVVVSDNERTMVYNDAFVGNKSKVCGNVNICDNAVKYNKENGTVDIIINQTDKKVNVIVRDTGIGIPQEHQQRVFERFYRVDKSHSKKVGGTGLGLAIVKHGAIYHNAEIKLESEENKGTTITLTFDKA